MHPAEELRDIIQVVLFYVVHPPKDMAERDELSTSVQRLHELTDHKPSPCPPGVDSARYTFDLRLSVHRCLGKTTETVSPEDRERLEKVQDELWALTTSTPIEPVAAGPARRQASPPAGLEKSRELCRRIAAQNDQARAEWQARCRETGLWMEAWAEAMANLNAAVGRMERDAHDNRPSFDCRRHAEEIADALARIARDCAVDPARAMWGRANRDAICSYYVSQWNTPDTILVAGHVARWAVQLVDRFLEFGGIEVGELAEDIGGFGLIDAPRLMLAILRGLGEPELPAWMTGEESAGADTAGSDPSEGGPTRNGDGPGEAEPTRGGGCAIPAPEDKAVPAPPAWTELGDAKRNILTALRGVAARLDGRGVARKAGYKEGSLRHHYGELQRWGYIDRTKDGYAITPDGANLVPRKSV